MSGNFKFTVVVAIAWFIIGTIGVNRWQEWFTKQPTTATWMNDIFIFGVWAIFVVLLPIAFIIGTYYEERSSMGSKKPRCGRKRSNLG